MLCYVIKNQYLIIIMFIVIIINFVLADCENKMLFRTALVFIVVYWRN